MRKKVKEYALYKDDEFIDLGTVDHLSRFREYILSNIGNDEIILEELEEVLK